MELVPFKTREDELQPGLVQAIEELLADAKAGKIHRLVAICVDDHTGTSHRIYHRAIDTTLIGALSCMVHKLQADWNN
jgi:hypothetical protein